MESEGLIERTVVNNRPVEIDYSLTKKGNALKSLLVLLDSFSLKYNSQEVFKDENPKLLDKLLIKPCFLKYTIKKIIGG